MCRDTSTFTFYVTLKDVQKMNALGDIRPSTCVSVSVLVRKVHAESAKSFWLINPLKPNDTYRGRKAPLASKRCILYIYSTNIGTE
jgi:hypothetical protein